MKTEEEWLKIYKECWHLINREGHNRVRLKLGQFRDDDRWAYIEVLGGGIEFLKKLIPFCEKHGLDMDFHKEFEFKLKEKDDCPTIE